MKELLEANTLLGNMIWNAGWFVLALWLIKKWMNNMERKVTNYCQQNREDHKELHGRITGHETRISRLEGKEEAG